MQRQPATAGGDGGRFRAIADGCTELSRISWSRSWTMPTACPPPAPYGAVCGSSASIGAPDAAAPPPVCSLLIRSSGQASRQLSLFRRSGPESSCTATTGSGSMMGQLTAPQRMGVGSGTPHNADKACAAFAVSTAPAARPARTKLAILARDSRFGVCRVGCTPAAALHRSISGSALNARARAGSMQKPA